MISPNLPAVHLASNLPHNMSLQSDAEAAAGRVLSLGVLDSIFWDN
jgi:hypothetical protein